MQIKDKINFIIIIFTSFLFFNLNLAADEFDISAKEIIIDKDNETIVGKESVQAKDSEGKIIYADKIVYKKNNEFLLAEGNVEIVDVKGNILKTNKATYDKLNEIISTYSNTEILLNDGYKLIGKNILYNSGKK